MPRDDDDRPRRRTKPRPPGGRRTAFPTAVGVTNLVYAGIGLTAGAYWAYYGFDTGYKLMKAGSNMPAEVRKRFAETYKGMLPDTLGLLWIICGVIALLFAGSILAAGIGIILRQQWGKVLGIVAPAVGLIVPVLFLWMTLGLPEDRFNRAEGFLKNYWWYTVVLFLAFGASLGLNIAATSGRRAAEFR